MQDLSSRATVNVQLYLISIVVCREKGDTALLREPGDLLETYCHVLHVIGDWRDGFVDLLIFKKIISSNVFLHGSILFWVRIVVMAILVYVLLPFISFAGKREI